MIPFQSPRGQLSPLPTDGPRTSDNITDKCEGTTARDWWQRILQYFNFNDARDVYTLQNLIKMI